MNSARPAVQHSWIRRRLLGAILIAGFAVSVSPASAQQPPAPVRVNVPMVWQETQVWCWVAVAEMAVRYHNLGRSLSQCQMLELAYRAPCCSTPAGCARPGHINEIATLIRGFGGRVSGLSLGGASPAALYDALGRGRVVIANINVQGSGHFVVVTALWPAVDGWYVSVNDPLFGPRSMPYLQFLQTWNASLVVY